MTKKDLPNVYYITAPQHIVRHRCKDFSMSHHLHYKALRFRVGIRVFQKKTFLKLSFALLTTHAIGL